MSRISEAGAAEVFSALGDQTRLSVVTRLGAAPLTATALSEGAQVTRQAIVKHLQVLEGAGLVTHEKRGREVLYTLKGDRLDEARLFLDGISAGWDRAIERLRGIVEEPPPLGSARSRTNAKRRRRRSD